jgi:perosamine synthetase
MGIDRSTHERTTPASYEWEYDVDEVGYKYTLNDYQAALGLSQLPELDAMNARRAARVGEYRKALSDLPGLCLLAQRADRRSSHHLFALRCAHRDGLIERLAERGIGAGVHYKRNDLYPMFETGALPNAEAFWRQIVSLPLHLDLTSRDVEEVVDAVRSVVGTGAS